VISVLPVFQAPFGELLVELYFFTDSAMYHSAEELPFTVPQFISLTVTDGIFV
jgi:hypothetical protein